MFESLIVLLLFVCSKNPFNVCRLQLAGYEGATKYPFFIAKSFISAAPNEVNCQFVCVSFLPCLFVFWRSSSWPLPKTNKPSSPDTPTSWMGHKRFLQWTCLLIEWTRKWVEPILISLEVLIIEHHHHHHHSTELFIEDKQSKEHQEANCARTWRPRESWVFGLASFWAHFGAFMRAISHQRAPWLARNVSRKQSSEQSRQSRSDYTNLTPPRVTKPTKSMGAPEFATKWAKFGLKGLAVLARLSPAGGPIK